MRERFASWRARASPRERWLAGVGAVLVVAAAAWALALDPLTRDLASTEAALRDAQSALARARAQADALAGLARTATPAVAGDARTAVERVLVQRGLRGAATALQDRGARVELTFEAIEFAALTALVDALGREAQLFPVDVLLAARTTPGSVRAEIAFALPPAR